MLYGGVIFLLFFSLVVVFISRFEDFDAHNESEEFDEDVMFNPGMKGHPLNQFD